MIQMNIQVGVEEHNYLLMSMDGRRKGHQKNSIVVNNTYINKCESTERLYAPVIARM